MIGVVNDSMLSRKQEVIMDTRELEGLAKVMELSDCLPDLSQGAFIKVRSLNEIAKVHEC